MLVIHVLWLQAALAMAQLPTLNDLLDGEGVVGRQDEGSVAVPAIDEQPIASAEEAVPSAPGLLDLIGTDAAVPVPTIASTDESIPDAITDPIIGSTDILDVGEEAPVTSVDVVEEPPVTPIPVPEPTPVETVAETPAPEVVVQPPELPTPEPTPVTEQAPPPPPPLPVPVAVDEQEEEVQQPVEEITVPSPAPAPDPVVVPDPVPEPDADVVEVTPPAPIAVPATSEAAVPSPEVTAPAADEGADVFVPPAAASPTQDTAAATSPATSPATAPPPSTDSDTDNDNSDSSADAAIRTATASPDSTSGPSSGSNDEESLPITAPVETINTPATPTAEAQEPVLTLVTTDGSTFMSVFIPPAPTQAIAVIQGTGFPSSDSSSSSGDSSSPDNSRINTDGPYVDTVDPDSPSSPPTRASNSSGLSTETKIGVGAGLGVGSVVLAVVVTYLLWHKRMGSGPFRRRSAKKGHKRGGSDLEKGGSGTLSVEEKQKLDWESEHDMPFDFGFPRERERGSVKRDDDLLRDTPGGEEGKVESSGVGTVVYPVEEVVPGYRR
ncbi:hypothetical protein QBC35DRAFT_531952 [Podospora australis]|uniref:Mid2 domain-containing protein n=1 Tax=Podospora australis TaxID=1536484 RepID=A0AAN6WTK1_9PEZI|nr:hypothetical protein QBC35DRAFT_531952 [Podospora australis]